MGLQRRGARAVIVSCESIIPTGELRATADANSLPPFLVDAVVEAPCPPPTTCFRRYDDDPAFPNTYRAAAKNDEAFAAWLDNWVYGVAGHDEYLARVGAPR